MTPVRLGAVGYLNARPLVHGLDRLPDRFAVRFDVPARCATLLEERVIDVGLIPSIGYCSHADYRIVPDVGICSSGPVASVALFTTRPRSAIRSIALDSNSRTSAALLRILCARSFDIEPDFITMGPDLPSMLAQCDAALLIGDIALFADHRSAGLQKIDLGEEWTKMTGLPFVYAFWTGWSRAIDGEVIGALQRARDAGRDAFDQIAAAYCDGDPDREAIARAYLRDNVSYSLGQRERAGLRAFFAAAAELGIVAPGASLRF